MSHDTSSTSNNPHIPNDYNPLPSNFQAPSHDLNKNQVEDIVELAERTGHEQGSQGSYSTSSHSGLAGGSSHGDHTGDTSSHSHGGSGLISERGGHSSTGSGVGAGLGREDRDDQYETSKKQQDTSNRAPTLGTDSRVHQNEVNAIPGVGDAAPKPGQANVGGTNTGKTGPLVGQSGSDPAAEGRLGETGSEYPEQRHAGKAGLGPHYHENHGGILQTIKDKLHGGQKAESERAVAEDQVNQDPLRNPVAGESSLSGNKGHLNPDDSKGLASKRLGEDSTTLGSH